MISLITEEISVNIWGTRYTCTTYLIGFDLERKTVAICMFFKKTAGVCNFSISKFRHAWRKQTVRTSDKNSWLALVEKGILLHVNGACVSSISNQKNLVNRSRKLTHRSCIPRRLHHPLRPQLMNQSMRSAGWMPSPCPCWWPESPDTKLAKIN